MNCLIVDDMHPTIFSFLEKAGIAVRYEPTLAKEEVLGIIHEYEGIIVRSKLKLDKEFFSKATKLQFIGRAGSGKDNIDVAEAERRNITILNAPEGNRDAVAEHALGMLLCLLNKLLVANEQVKHKIWKREANRGVELGHQTVGIIGYGNTGRAMSKRLLGFGCKVLAYDIRGIVEPEAEVLAVGLEELQKEAQIITVHIPLDQRNKYYIGKDFFEQLAHPIWLINTSRGEVLNTQDLIEALKSGKVLGAGLDVLENEKLATYTEAENKLFEELAAFPQVMMSPHVAGWTHESYVKISVVLGEKIRDFISRAN
jgi:D-3-phosphoglycerate dehydrogenase / 2-oxoglutarate reductase